MFSTVHIGLTAAVVGLAGLAILAVFGRPMRRSSVVGIVLTSMAATFGWRMAANVDALNQDGVSWVSANDVLAPVLTYIMLGMYATFFPPTDTARFERLRCALTAAALVVNVLAI